MKLDKTILDIGWSSIATLCGQLLSLVVVFIVAKEIDAKQFGVYSVVIVWLTFVAIIRDGGFNQIIIQKKNIFEEDLNTIYTVNVVLGFFFFVVSLIFSSYFSSYFSTKDVEPILQIISFKILIDSFYIAVENLLKRKRRFKTIGLIQSIAGINSNFIAILLLLLDFGIMSLVYQLLVNSFILLVLFNVFNREKIKLNFSRSSFIQIRSFGRDITLIQLLSFFTQKFDDFLIGKIIGLKELGAYSLAFNILLGPYTLVSKQFYNVYFPVFSRIQGDSNSQQILYKKILFLIALIMSPLVFGFYSIINDVCLLFFNKTYENIDSILKIFSIGSIALLLGLPGMVLMSNNETKLFLKASIKSRIVSFILLMVGIYSLNPMCVAKMTALGMIIHVFILNNSIKKMIGLGFLQIVNCIIIPVLLGLLMLVIISLISSYINVITYYMLIFKVIIGAIFYILLIRIFLWNKLKLIINKYDF